VSEPGLASSQGASTSNGESPARAAVILVGGLRAACMLLTRFPVGSRSVPLEARRWAAAFLPLVGLGLGLLGALALAGLELRLAPRLAAALTIGLMLLTTGALHEDGLADTADALGGARTRERLFTILKDSRLGTYGVLALALSLLFRIEALAELGPRGPAAFALAAVLSRAPLVWLMRALPYVTPESLARSADLVRVSKGAVAVATSLSLAAIAGAVALGVLSWAHAALALLAVGLVALLSGWRFLRRAGGITGDFLGAAQQACEVAVLVTLLAAA
jgi:adenosylcobinamide-GDP ribazoletransferase